LQDNLANIDQPVSNPTRMKGVQFPFAVEPVSNTPRTKEVQLPFAAQSASNSTRMKGVQFPFAVNDHVMIMVGLFTTEFGSLIYSDTKFMHLNCAMQRGPHPFFAFSIIGCTILGQGLSGTFWKYNI
jgi:hypothetical protein